MNLSVALRSKRVPDTGKGVLKTLKPIYFLQEGGLNLDRFYKDLTGF
jgi:hypothetical protein